MRCCSCQSTDKRPTHAQSHADSVRQVSAHIATPSLCPGTSWFTHNVKLGLAFTVRKNWHNATQCIRTRAHATARTAQRPRHNTTNASMTLLSHCTTPQTKANQGKTNVNASCKADKQAKQCLLQGASAAPNPKPSHLLSPYQLCWGDGEAADCYCHMLCHSGGNTHACLPHWTPSTT